jgi:hypothetical protein
MEVKITVDETEPLAFAFNEAMEAAINALGEGIPSKSKYSFDLNLVSAFTIAKKYEEGNKVTYTVVPDRIDMKHVDGSTWEPRILRDF